MEKYLLDIEVKQNAVDFFQQAEVINYCVFDVVCNVFLAEEDKLWMLLAYNYFFDDFTEDSIYDEVCVW
jgi:hypothetical protein